MNAPVVTCLVRESSVPPLPIVMALTALILAGGCGESDQPVDFGLGYLQSGVWEFTETTLLEFMDFSQIEPL